jgi:DNA end-binding protein Ku
VAPRAYWKGYLKLSLVSCPIALYPATSQREKISFHQINKETGNRIKYRKVDAETGDEVEASDIIKGYEVGKGEYLEVDPKELEAIAIESKRTIEIDEFVPRKEIDELYLSDPYYLVPDGEVGQQAFAVIREAIREEGMVALARVVFTSREHVIALEPRGWRRAPSLAEEGRAIERAQAGLGRLTIHSRQRAEALIPAPRCSNLSAVPPAGLPVQCPT